MFTWVRDWADRNRPNRFSSLCTITRGRRVRLAAELRKALKEATENVERIRRKFRQRFWPFYHRFENRTTPRHKVRERFEK